MRKFFALMAVVLLCVTTVTAFAKVDPQDLMVKKSMDPRMGSEFDIPARAPGGFARTDTVDFGYFTVIGGEYYAVQGDSWTWDHGSTNTFEGWYATDITANPGAYFQQITTAIWGLAHWGNLAAAPIIAGTGSMWVGKFESQADSLCWDSGLGYGNDWCQRATSPSLTYDGTGTVALGFSYFQDSEDLFDYTKVILKRVGNETVLNAPGFSNKIGTPPTGPWAAYTRTISNAEFGGTANPVAFNIVFEFSADTGWSDEDSKYATTYGPFAADHVTVAGNIGTDVAYEFESGMDGWTVAPCVGKGSFFAIHPRSDYLIKDPCVCELSGNVVSFHDQFLQHPSRQKVMAWSPIADRTNLQQYNSIMADWDMYAELPEIDDVLYRPGWRYYPFTCPQSGLTSWSGRQGQEGYFFAGDQPDCYATRNTGTQWGVPAGCNLVGFVFEVYNSCVAGAGNCSGQSNFTPIIDNVKIRMTGVANAPVISYAVGCYYQDNFANGLVLSTTDTGDANVNYDTRMDLNTPDKLGDSLVVIGPGVLATSKWESKLWFRVRREGPGQSSIGAYNTWKTRVTTGAKPDNIVGAAGAFTWGQMDSVEIGTTIYKNQWSSYFREDDPSKATGPDTSRANGIILDRILTPGTQIEFFTTANYTCHPTEYYLLPDTTGKYYQEFEILPSYRTVARTDKFPCILYVDAMNNSVQFYVENALNVVLHGAGSGAPIPNPANWDRYDYIYSASNWHGALFRKINANSGASLPQMLGYRMILLDTGLNPAGTCETADWRGFGDWLSAVTCGSNTNVQGLVLAGEDIAQIIADPLKGYPSLLTSFMGASYNCTAYYEPGCPSVETENDSLYCVRLPYNPGGPWAPTVPVDIWGNWCPPQLQFDVLSTSGTGVGNKTYENVNTAYKVNYSQITKDAYDAGGTTSNYRTVIQGYSFGRLAKKDLAASPPLAANECPSDSGSIVEAVINEVREAIKWTLHINDPLTDIGLCVNPCGIDDVPDGTVVDAGKVNRLYQNHPNPFNPRTMIRFSLAQAGPAKLIIYDVNGRKVKTLVNGPQAAGLHELVWDGTDDAGHTVASGIYWSQLSSFDFSSSKKLVVLK